jgi:protein involved in sex pheromone biosynthesis
MAAETVIKGQSMKKTGMAVLMAVLIISACNNGFYSNNNESNERVNKSKRTVIDASKYVDFTVMENNAAMFKKDDLIYTSFGTFRNGNSYIKIDRKEGTVELSSDNAYYEEKEGQQFFAKYQFDVQAANNDCLYIKQPGKKNGTAIVNEYVFNDAAIPDLLVCIPLYGFGKNRIEVSSIMDGYIAMPSGTYWLSE